MPVNKKPAKPVNDEDRFHIRQNECTFSLQYLLNVLIF